MKPLKDETQKQKALKFGYHEADCKIPDAFLSLA